MECIENMDGDQSKILELMDSLQKSVDEHSRDFKDSLREGDRDKAIKAAMHLKYFHKVIYTNDVTFITETVIFVSIYSRCWTIWKEWPMLINNTLPSTLILYLLLLDTNLLFSCD